MIHACPLDLLKANIDFVAPHALPPLKSCLLGANRMLPTLSTVPVFSMNLVVPLNISGRRVTVKIPFLPLLFSNVLQSTLVCVK